MHLDPSPPTKTVVDLSPSSAARDHFENSACPLRRSQRSFSSSVSSSAVHPKRRVSTKEMRVCVNQIAVKKYNLVYSSTNLSRTARKRLSSLRHLMRWGTLTITNQMHHGDSCALRCVTAYGEDTRLRKTETSLKSERG